MSELVLVNPRKRRKSPVRRKKRRVSRALSTVSRRVRRSIGRRRRNPIRTAGALATVKTSAIGAVGALGVDIAMQKLPIPASLTANPIMAAATKGFVGIGLGMLVSKIGKDRSLGKDIAHGAVTVSLYNAMKGAIGPSLGLSGISDDGLLGWDDGLLGYEDFNDDVGMGWMGPAATSPYMGGYEDF